MPLAYTGTVPDPFREGREVIVTVQKQGARFVGERNSLITKCPSKYKTAPPSEKQNPERAPRRDRGPSSRPAGSLMAGLGFVCLLLALAVCAYGIGASLYGVRSGRSEFVGLRPPLRCTRSPAILTVAFAVLEVAFLRNDFAFNTVADTSSRTTPVFYRAAAVWSSQEGSLLLWAWLLSLWSSLALFLTRKRCARSRAYATAILLGLRGASSSR